VLSEVDLDVARGEVHALLGGNGSGTSTLIKILAGYHHPDPGATGSVGGLQISLGAALAAGDAGVRFVHQDLGLVETMSVAENLLLDQRSTSSFWIGDRGDAARARKLLTEFQLEIDPMLPVALLTASQKTMVAVLRTIRDGLDRLGLLVLDEPTSTLPGHETAVLFEFLRALRERGASVLYVTHRLEEVFDLADRVTVLRDGHRVLTSPVSELTQASLVESIVGRPVDTFYPSPPVRKREVALFAESLGGSSVASLTFTGYRGEIVGFGGLTGSGRESVAALLGGAIPWRSGTLKIGDRTYDSMVAREAIERGLAYMPADRKRLGSIAEFTVRENLTLPRPSVERTGWLSLRAERDDARHWIEELDIVPREPEARFAVLSGGNQQRAILARWLRCESKIFLLDEPTQGVDVAGKAAIYRALAAAAQDGATVVLASTDAEELAATCDRVLVFRNGTVTAELSREDLSPQTISHYEHVDL
jgi:ribose transport system ATP-binding protein